MGYEIDFLPVGDGSHGGDAIALRYGNLDGPRTDQTVIVIDGGYSDDGTALVEHVREHYNTDFVDIVVSTHPDRDHISGLEVVLKELRVGQLLMHLPWKHSRNLAEARQSGFSKMALSEKLEKSLQETSDLEAIANEKGIPITEPFAGLATSDGCFRVLGPSEEYYEELLPGITTPTSSGVRASLAKAVEAVRAKIAETLRRETLRDDGVTRPSNNSSVISLLNVDGRLCLLTGDAGIPALDHVADLLQAEGFTPGDLRFIQVPHHGSRRNVGPSVLNRLLGDIGVTPPTQTAFVSAPPDNPEAKHPAKKVTNAFLRRGYKVHATQGHSKRHSHGAPDREGWSPSTPLPFYDEVDDDSES